MDMGEVIVGLVVFALVVGGLVCFVGSFLMIFSVQRNQKKMFQMLSTLLREVAVLKAARGDVKPKAEKDKSSSPAATAAIGEPAKPVEAKPPLAAAAAAKFAEKSLREKMPEPAPVTSSSAAPPPLPVKQVETRQGVPRPATPEHSRAPVKPAVPQKPEVSGFERRAGEILGKIWNWIVVGEEFRNPRLSMEYAIASVWLLRVAIFILVVGGGFFVNYSIEKGWLGPVARVSGILLAGMAMVALGCWMANKKYHLIAQGLLGGGIVFMYMGIFAGYSRFKIIEVMPAFALMILITLVAGILSVRLNSLFVAIFGLIGGYLTPVLIDTGSGNLPGLFSYMLLLGVGALWIARYRDWKLLNALAFFFTYALFFAAMDKHYEISRFAMAMSFLVAFFILFSFIPILYNIINRQKATVLELMFILFNSSIFALMSFDMVTDKYDKEYYAIVTISLALFYIGQIYFFLQRKLDDRNFLITLTGFASVFITLTIPALLSEQWITTAWAIQAAVFIWMSCKIKSNFVRLIANILYFLTLGRIITVDFGSSFYRPAGGAEYWPEMLDRFMTMGVTIISLAVSSKMLKRAKDSFTPYSFSSSFSSNDIGDVMERSALAKVFFWIVFLSTFVYVQFEFYYLFQNYYPPFRITVLTLIWLGAMLFILRISQKSPACWGLLIAFVSCFLIKLAFVDLNFWEFTFDGLVYSGVYSYEAALMRLLSFLPAVLFFGYVAFVLQGGGGSGQIPDREQLASHQVFAVISLILLFFYSTFEVNTFLGDRARGFQAGGVSILWSLFAIAFLLRGISKRSKAFRYTGLTLFVIVVLKVFFSDLSRLDQLYRIIAFIILGLIILGASFAYIRFRESFSTALPEGQDTHKTKKGAGQ